MQILFSPLEARFQPKALRALTPLFDRSEDMEQLRQLAPAAGQAESLKMFLAALRSEAVSHSDA